MSKRDARDRRANITYIPQLIYLFIYLLFVVHMKTNIILTYLVEMKQTLYFPGEMQY